MKGVRGCHAAADLMQKFDVQDFFGPGGFFGHCPTSQFILQLLSCAAIVTLKRRSVPVQRAAMVVNVFPVET
jgi:hypothetical protein